LRKSLTDPYFRRSFTGLSFSEEEFRRACDVFGDVIVVRQDARQASRELAETERIVGDGRTAKEKCHEVWRLVRGEPSVSNGGGQ
jgi:hypothetical protein